MGVTGWATTGMAARYQHMTDPIRADIARRVGGLMWKAAAPTAGELLTEPTGELLTEPTGEQGAIPGPPDGQLRPKLRPPTAEGRTHRVRPSTFCLVKLAEDTRFELVRGFPQHAFQACALGH